MRHGQTLDLEALRREAAAALSASGRTQADVANALGVPQPNLSRALRPGEPKGATVLQRVVALLTPYDVEEVTTPAFRVVRKPDASAGPSQVP